MTFSLPFYDSDRAPPAKRVVLVTVDDFPCPSDQTALINYERLCERGARATMKVKTGNDRHMRWLPLVTGLSRSAQSSSRQAVERVEPVPKSITSAGFQTAAFLPEVDPQTRARLQLVGRQLGFQHISFRGTSSPDILRSAVPALCNQRRGLIVIHFPHIEDESAQQWRSMDFLGHAGRVDQSLGILTSLSGALSGDTVLVVATSPTCEGASLDPSAEIDLNVAFCGKAITASSFDRIGMVDVSATIMWMLGLSIPLGHEGKPIAPLQYAESL